MKSMSKLAYHYGLKVRIYPSDKQKQIIKVNSDASRFIYNQMVGINQEIHQLKRVGLPIDTIQTRLAQLEKRRNARELTNHFSFLADSRIDSLAKANAIQNYQKAWQQFLKVHHAGVPKFHRKSAVWQYQTNCQYPGQTVAKLTNGTVRFINTNQLIVPKLGKLRIRGSHKRLLKRLLDTRIGTVTIMKDASDRFYLAMQLASDWPFVTYQESHPGSVGIDLNLENFLTDSNGQTVANPRHYRNSKKRLAKEQRTLSRRARRAKREHRSLKTSKNYQKQRRLVAQLHDKVRTQRHQFLHQLSTTLIKSHDLVVAEELRSKNLLKNHALAMSISDVGWRTFLGMLTYKANLYGTTFVTVDPRNTTQACSECAFVMGTEGTKKLTLAQRKWQCPSCQTDHIRDWNAAQNVLDKGLKKLKSA
ncbi:RNA-guided endonuclease InsQ/TnpB family protein [Secundilactobacillus muriivasis]